MSEFENKLIEELKAIRRAASSVEDYMFCIALFVGLIWLHGC